MTMHLLVCGQMPMMCAGLKALLEQRLDAKVGIETTAASALRVAQEARPAATIVIAPALTIEHTSELAALAAVSKVILVAKAENTHRSVEALRVGVRAVLPPDGSGEELVHVVKMVIEGDTMVIPAAARGSLGRMPGSRPSELALRMAQGLTAREKEVLLLLIGGKSNCEIAEKLSVSMTTVRSHVHHLLRKLGVGSRGQAVAVAYETGLVNEIRQG